MMMVMMINKTYSVEMILVSDTEVESRIAIIIFNDKDCGLRLRFRLI